MYAFTRLLTPGSGDRPRWGFAFACSLALLAGGRSPFIPHASLQAQQSAATHVAVVEPNSIPGLSIQDAAVTEGHSGTKTATFAVTLSATSQFPVSVNYATTSDTATLRTTTTALRNPELKPIRELPTVPNPSTIVVPEIAGTIDDLKVVFHGFSHTNPDDVDVLLVGPTGQAVILMSDVGGISAVDGLTLTLDDTAPPSATGSEL